MAAMSQPPRSAADRETLRALIVDALGDLGEGVDSRTKAEELMRALDRYIESAPATPSPISAPAPVVADETRARGLLFGVLGCAVVATIVSAFLLPGGALAGVVILGIWVAAIVILAST